MKREMGKLFLVKDKIQTDFKRCSMLLDKEMEKCLAKDALDKLQNEIIENRKQEMLALSKEVAELSDFSFEPFNQRKDELNREFQTILATKNGVQEVELFLESLRKKMTELVAGTDPHDAEEITYIAEAQLALSKKSAFRTKQIKNRKQKILKILRNFRKRLPPIKIQMKNLYLLPSIKMLSENKSSPSKIKTVLIQNRILPSPIWKLSETPKQKQQFIF